jgi:L-aminopeptidase/D-esterase-like protein
VIDRSNGTVAPVGTNADDVGIGTGPAGTDPFGHGALTDVPGVRVGHHRRIGAGWQTGTTVVFCPDGATAAVDVRGGGPGTRETEALAPTNLVDRINAVCLTGGSAYGLSAADGVMAELERRRLGVRVGPDPSHVVPVVPTAVIFDLARGGRFAHRPGPDFGRRAARDAASRPRPGAASSRPVRGTIGAGTGAVAGGLQGGIGSASTDVDVGGATVTVGALAVVNAAGSPIDPATGLPWVRVPGLRRPDRTERRRVAQLVETRSRVPLNTTIGVVATDAHLDRAHALRLAMSAHDGLARAIRPAHGLTDGDTVFALSTADRIRPDEPRRSDVFAIADLDRLCVAAALVFERACIDAIVNAVTVGGAPAYRDLCPGAFTGIATSTVTEGRSSRSR